MGKIKLELPEKFEFHTEIPVRITDLNYGGHLGNDSVLTLIHEARVRFLKSHGYTEMDVCGASLIQADTVIVYKQEAYYGTLIDFAITVSDFSPAACDFFYLLTDKASGDEIARAKTRIVFFNYQTRKKLPVPEEFRAKFE
ncbi:MAG: thioesterase family protein [Bacteroidales bacterium]|nr:thioesterase family protein [Bacteroidales bacterium]